jgi:hypothetical protein
MDYIFFAFSAMCLGFFVLLCMMLFRQEDHRPRPVHLLLAGAAALVYYFLEISVFSHQPWMYNLANLLPQLLLLLSLAAFLWRSGKN